MLTLTEVFSSLLSPNRSVSTRTLVADWRRRRRRRRKKRRRREEEEEEEKEGEEEKEVPS